MASREELLQSIRPDMTLTKAFFMRIYGYEITWPGFAEVALQRLEEIGCSKAREYYGGFVAEYEAQDTAEMKEAGKWYAEQIQKKEGSDNTWKTRKEELLKRKRELLIAKSQILTSN